MGVVLLITIVVLLIVVAYALGRELDELKRELKEFEYELKNLFKDRLEKLEDRLEEMSLSGQEKEQRAFENAPDLNLAFFQKLRKGQIVRLMRGSYHYPHEDIFIDSFNYKHDHIAGADMEGYEVHGFEQLDPLAGEWEPIMFVANEKECATSTGAGSIKMAVLGIR